MKKFNSETKRKLRNRSKLRSVSSDRFRISVFKSLKNLSAQIIDDKNKVTLVSASSTEKAASPRGTVTPKPASRVLA